jgi:hypothetical protein
MCLCVKAGEIKLPLSWTKSGLGRARGIRCLIPHDSRRSRCVHTWKTDVRAVTTTGQFCTKPVISKNLEAVSRIITDAAKAGAKMIFLPEASDFIANGADESASLTKPLAQSEFVQGVRARAKETGVWVSVGVHETVCALLRIPSQLPYRPSRS